MEHIFNIPIYYVLFALILTFFRMRYLVSAIKHGKKASIAIETILTIIFLVLIIGLLKFRSVT